MKLIYLLGACFIFSLAALSQAKLQVIKDDLSYESISACKDGMMVFKQGTKYGYMNKGAVEVIPAQFDEAYDFNEGYAGAKKDGKWGIIDKTGKWKVQPQFPYVSYLVKHGVFQFYDSSKWGARDLNNNIILPPRYTTIEVFSNFLKGTTGSSYSNYKYKLFDLKGKELLPVEFDGIETDDKSEIAMIKKSDVYKIIDNTGKITCDSFDNYTLSSVKNNLVIAKNRGTTLYGVTDRTGKMIIPCMYTSLSMERDEDLFLVSKKVSVWGNSETKYGFVDKTNKEIIPVTNYSVSNFRSGLAYAKDSSSSKGFYFNTKGGVAIPKRFTYGYDFAANGLAKVTLKVDGKDETHYITTKGVDIGTSSDAYPLTFSEGIGTVKKPSYLLIMDKNKSQKKVEGYLFQWNISDGLIPVQDKDNKYGFIDLNGKVVVPCSYDFFGVFKNGMASVGKKVTVSYSTKNLYGYVAKDGKEILPGQLTEAAEFSNGYALVKDESSTKKYFINTRGEKQTLPREYPEIYGFKDGYAVAKAPAKTGATNPTWIFINTNFKEVDSVTSQSLYFFSDGYALIIGPEYKVLDKNLKQVGSFKNENIDSVKTFAEEIMCFKDKTAKKWGFKNTKGETIIEPQFVGTAMFKEGMCAVLTDKGWGYINTKGTMVIPADYETVNNFSSGFAAVKKNGRWGYIDKTGKYWLEPKYSRITDFTDSKAVVKVENIYQLVKAPQ